MHKRIVLMISLLVFAALACSTQAAQPTSTPAATLTPIPPTSTPTPSPTPTPVLGIDKPLKFAGANFIAFHVYSTPVWKIDGEDAYPQALGDIFLVVELEVTGNLNTVPLPQGDDPSINFHIRDSNGRKDVWSSVDPSAGGIYMVFVVDGSAENYFFVFPNQSEIDLRYLEVQPFPIELTPST